MKLPRNTKAKGPTELAGILADAPTYDIGDENLPATRAVLVAALDDLLSEPATSDLISAKFWTFVSQLARGRGIAEEISRSAESLAPAPARARGTTPRHLRNRMWATLFHVIKRLEVGGGHAVPQGAWGGVFKGTALNFVTGRGQYPDVLSPKPVKRDVPLRRGAKRLLLCEVYRYAREQGVCLTDAREAILPGYLENRTWQNWQKYFAEDHGIRPDVIGDFLKKLDATTHPFRPDQQQIQRYWAFASEDEAAKKRSAKKTNASRTKMKKSTH